VNFLADNAANPIVLYDGVCGLCNRMVQFILRRDRRSVFRFASLQSSFAASILTRHEASPTDLDTFYIVLNHKLQTGGFATNQLDELLLARSDAVIFLLDNLGGIWQVMARLFRLLPRALRNWLYEVVAHNRYRIFGRYDACPVPDTATRSRFLDF
jgi:predicted DCC family thiol-disulfide oxidoreductase YuxK